MNRLGVLGRGLPVRWLAVLLCSWPVADVSAEDQIISATAASSDQQDRSSAESFVAEGKLVQLPRSVQLVVGNSATALPRFSSQLPVGPKGERVTVQTVEVDGGRVDAMLAPQTGAPRGVLLQAPDKILGISTGGHLVISVEVDEVLIAAVEGDALVGQDSRFKPLPSGTVRRLSRRGGLAKDEPLPEAPRLKNAGGLSVALEGGVEIPVQITASSEVLVGVFDEAGVPLGPLRVRAPGSTVSISLPRAGTYFARAQSLGPGKIGGALSEPVRLQVLGLAAGQSAPQDGIFLLDRGERVRLAGTDGLEMRYGRSPTFVPAASTVGLPGGRATTVEFRDPAEPKSAATLRLAPRVQRVDVAWSPAGAKWPGKPIEVRLGVWDGAGRLMSLGADYQAQVTVNAQPLDVSWVRTDRGMVAKVESQEGAGPWVVRVKAVDPRGTTIVRDFLEVAAR